MAVDSRQSEPDAGPVLQQGRWPESKRPMSLGLMLPIAELDAVANDSPGENFWDIVAMARLAVEIGFETLWLPDHFILKLERHGGQARGVWDCWTTVAALAAVVSDVQIGTMVAATSFHNPGSIAKMAENIDAISRGRFILGLGCGWHEDEYRMYGFPYDHRVDRSRKRCRSSPRCCGPAGPISMGSITKRTTRSISARSALAERRRADPDRGEPAADERLTARYADAWNSDWQDDPDFVLGQLRALDEACREVGREPASLVRTEGSQFAMEGCKDRWQPIRGSIDDMAAAMKRFAALGLRHISARPIPARRKRSSVRQGDSGVDRG